MFINLIHKKLIEYSCLAGVVEPDDDDFVFLVHEELD